VVSQDGGVRRTFSTGSPLGHLPHRSLQGIVYRFDGATVISHRSGCRHNNDDKWKGDLTTIGTRVTTGLQVLALTPRLA
jgi:hypothetical protein